MKKKKKNIKFFKNNLKLSWIINQLQKMTLRSMDGKMMISLLSK